MLLGYESSEVQLGPGKVCFQAIVWAEVEPCKRPVIWGLICRQVYMTVSLRRDAAAVELLHIRSLRGISERMP